MPNRNAYLGVCFNDATRLALVELQGALAEHLEREGYAFDKMSPQDLHMTFFFAGEQLSQLKPDTLASWHADLTAAVQRADLGGVILRLNGISVFPPGKSNLLCATFHAPVRLHELQRLVEEGAHSAGIRSSGSQAQLEYGGWVPHVTLGKVRASKAAVEGAASGAARCVWHLCGHGVDEGVGAFAPVHGVMDSLLAAPVDGLSLCGEQPKQLWRDCTDWRQTLKF